MFDEARRRVREELQRLEIDACLVTTPANIFYTTGFYSPVVNLSFRLMGTRRKPLPQQLAARCVSLRCSVELGVTEGGNVRV